MAMPSITTPKASTRPTSAMRGSVWPPTVKPRQRECQDKDQWNQLEHRQRGQRDADDRRQHEQEDTLHHRLGAAAQRLADGDRRAIDGRDQDFLEEAELAIPDDRHGAENR